MNRLTRDQILIRALDMIDSPSLDAKDRTSGTIVSGALSIEWLQNALDLFHNIFPWAGIVTSTSITVSAQLTALPADFIMDVRNGVVLTDPASRLLRWPLQKIISANVGVTTTGTPKRYTILPPNFRVFPTPDKAYAATFWYYALPAVLGASTVPNFPSDWVLIEYVRLRGMEWLGKGAPGIAEGYANEKIRDLRRSGLAFEPEDDTMQLDPEAYNRAGTTDWMGKPVL